MNKGSERAKLKRILLTVARAKIREATCGPMSRFTLTQDPRTFLDCGRQYAQGFEEALIRQHAWVVAQLGDYDRLGMSPYLTVSGDAPPC